MTDDDYFLDIDATSDEDQRNDTSLEPSVKYAVYVNPHTGVASLGHLIERQLDRSRRREIRLPQTIEASARASRKRLRDHAVFHQLGACLVLTYAQLPDNPRQDVEKFIRRVRAFYPGRLHYAVVTEGSDELGATRIHHNVLLPASPHLTEIAASWPHGGVFIGINPTDYGIRRAVNYVSKAFARPAGLSARFMKSKSKIPKPSKQVFNNKEEAEAAVMKVLPEDASGVSVYEPRCGDRKIFYWDVNPHQIEDV